MYINPIDPKIKAQNKREIFIFLKKRIEKQPNKEKISAPKNNNIKAISICPLAVKNPIITPKSAHQDKQKFNGGLGGIYL